MQSERLLSLLIKADGFVTTELLRANGSVHQTVETFLATSAILFALTHDRNKDLATGLEKVSKVYEEIYKLINETAELMPEKTALGLLQRMRAETEANAKH